MQSRYTVSIILIAILVLGSSLYTNAMGADLIAHWPLDQNSGDVVEDVAGNFNGKVTGGKALWVPAKFGNGLELQGPNHYVEVEKTAKLELKTVTLIAWVNFKALGADRQEIVSYADSFGIFTQSGVFRALIYKGGNSWGTVVGVTPVKQDTWYQVAEVVAENEIRLYVNGKLDATLAAPAINYQNFPMWFGGGPADNQFWMTGILDEIEIWNDVLTDAEIEKLFNTPPVLGVSASSKLAVTWGDVKSK